MVKKVLIKNEFQVTIMDMVRCFAFILLFLSVTCFAQEPSGDFVTGLEAYEKNEFTKAKEIFEPFLKKNPENPILLYNLGLTEYQMGNPGRALGLWRKARFLDESLMPIGLAIEFVEEQLFPQNNSKAFYQTIVNSLLVVPFWLWALMSLVSFFIAFWWSLEYGVKRKLELNLWPSWVFLLVPCFLFSSGFTVYLTLQSLQIEATVVEKDLLTYTTPSNTSPSIGELDEGQIVVVVKTHGEWAQIRTQTGSPGWVPKTTLIPFKGI